MQELFQQHEGFCMSKIADHLGVHQQALTLRAQRNEVLASNIANASTPNFKARDLNFLEELQRQTQVGAMDVSSPKHMTQLPSTSGPIQYRLPTAESLDGNTVELHVEQMQFAENVMNYQVSLDFLNRKITGLMSAIKGE